MNDELTKLPDDLTPLEDDGLADHLLGMKVPRMTLPSNANILFDLNSVQSKFVILYFFPMMGSPKKSLPLEWNKIAGARGCTPQNISINLHARDLEKYDASIIGVSTQPVIELMELSRLRGLSQTLLSDKEMRFQKSLNMPTFQLEGKRFYKRITLILKQSEIVKVFYPVFPPDKHVFDVLGWLSTVVG